MKSIFFLAVLTLGATATASPSISFTQAIMVKDEGGYDSLRCNKKAFQASYLQTENKLFSAKVSCAPKSWTSLSVTVLRFRINPGPNFDYQHPKSRVFDIPMKSSDECWQALEKLAEISASAPYTLDLLN